MLIPGGGGGTTGSSGGGGGGGGYGGTSGSSTTSGSNTSVASVPGHPGWTMSTTKETKINHQEIPVVIRADITYFRQDFSVTQLIGMGPGAEPFRFDYLARTRPLTNQELLLLKKYPEMHPALRQKETVLFALRELTGKDAGNDTLEWLALFPEAAEEVEAVKLCNEFVQASPAKQATLLAMLRDKKGPRYTQALVTAIPRLPEEMQGKARQALTERLARVPSSMLRDRLTEDDYEMRRAAAAACSKKEDRALVPDLIGLLEDGDERVGKAARTSLKTMTGKDHPNPSAWQAWWSEQGSE